MRDAIVKNDDMRDAIVKDDLDHPRQWEDDHSHWGHRHHVDRSESCREYGTCHHGYNWDLMRDAIVKDDGMRDAIVKDFMRDAIVKNDSMRDAIVKDDEMRDAIVHDDMFGKLIGKMKAKRAAKT